MGASLSPLLAISIWAVSMLIGAASMLPGGLGSTEVVMSGLLMLLGVDKSVAVVATVASLWVAVAIGMCVLVSLETGIRRSSTKMAKEKLDDGSGPY